MRASVKKLLKIWPNLLAIAISNRYSNGRYSGAERGLLVKSRFFNVFRLVTFTSDRGTA